MKKRYQKPQSAAIIITGNTMMEWWSVQVNNDPTQAIGDDNIGDLGARKFFADDNWNDSGFSSWD